MLILYQYPGGDGLGSISPPCLKIEMALRLLGCEFRVENLTSSAAARRVSATGRLPVVEIEGERISDSIVILDRLERAFPEAALWPTDPARRVRDRLWDHFGTDSVYWLGFHLRWVAPGTSAAFFNALFGRASWPLRSMVRLTFVPQQRKRAGLHGVGGKLPAQVLEEIERAFDMLVVGLEGGPFLQGRDRPGRGDLACASLMAQAGFRDTMPAVMGMIRSRPELPSLCVRTFEACSMPAPRWLG